MADIPFRKLSSAELVDRSALLTEAYIPYLRERHPIGVVAINLLTAEYVIGAQSPIAMDMYKDKFGDEAAANMWLEPIRWPDPRAMDEKLAEMEAWYRQRVFHIREKSTPVTK